jgi:hypothetical protein
MNMILVDFAVCPCGEQTAVRLSNLIPEADNPRWSETETHSLLIACTKCKRVCNYNKADLISRPTTMGMAPQNPGAPIRVFQVPVACAKENCESLPVIHVALSSNTNAEQLRRERLSWQWSDGELFCSLGHLIRWPQWEI